MQDADVESLRTVADYQFAAGAGKTLFPPEERFDIQRSSTGRPQQVARENGGRLVSVGLDGRFTLGLAGGQRLIDGLARPAVRVIVGDDSEPFVRDGKNVFAKFVQTVDPDVRAGDEVAIVHERGDLIAVGRAELDAGSMLDFDTGMAVMTRAGASPE